MRYLACLAVLACHDSCPTDDACDAMVASMEQVATVFHGDGATFELVSCDDVLTDSTDGEGYGRISGTITHDGDTFDCIAVYCDLVMYDQGWIAGCGGGSSSPCRLR